MGIFIKQRKVFNRAPVTLMVTFDGQVERVPPGDHTLPDITIPFAQNQNPIMGSQDPNNPHRSGGRYLIVVEGEDGYGTPLTKEEWQEHLGRPCRIDEQQAFQERYGSDPKAKLVTHGKGRKTVAQSRYDASATGGDADFSHRDA